MTSILEAMEREIPPATPSGEALVDLTSADGSRMQLYAYRSGSDHPAATVIRIWPDAAVRDVFAEYVVLAQYESILHDFFESVEGRENRASAV